MYLLPVCVCMAQNLFDTCVDANSLVAGIEKARQLIICAQAVPLLHAVCMRAEVLVRESVNTTAACTPPPIAACIPTSTSVLQLLAAWV
jgi:hypothetical protein